jgi:hypothetical protein
MMAVGNDQHLKEFRGRERPVGCFDWPPCFESCWIASREVLLLAFPALFLWLRTRGKTREELYDLLSSRNWGETTTNNLGLAPAEGDGPERFQLKMYEELYRLLRARGGVRGGERLLEVSCGRGGALNYLVKRWEGPLRAVGWTSRRQLSSIVSGATFGVSGDAEFVHVAIAKEEVARRAGRR